MESQCNCDTSLPDSCDYSGDLVIALPLTQGSVDEKRHGGSNFVFKEPVFEPPIGLARGACPPKL